MNRSDLESRIIARNAGLMKFARLDYTTEDGTNTDIGYALDAALSEMGESSVGSVQDEVRLVAGVEYFLLEAIEGSMCLAQLFFNRTPGGSGSLAGQAREFLTQRKSSAYRRFYQAEAVSVDFHFSERS